MSIDQGVKEVGNNQGADETARVFFALWPDEAVRQRLHEASGHLHKLRGGRRIHPDKLHLTLLFIGALPRERVEDLISAAAEVKAPAFDVCFDRPECWRRNRIAFLGASEPPAALFALVAALEENVAQAGIEFDRRPYKAHITLLRNADCRKEDGVSAQAYIREADVKAQSAGRSHNSTLEPLVWAARDFVLVESSISNEGASYRVLARWPLL